jgi:hypothetical protein
MITASIYLLIVLSFALLISAIYFYKPISATPSSGPILNWVCKSTVDKAVAAATDPLKKEIDPLKKEIDRLNTQNKWALDNDAYIDALNPLDCVEYAIAQKNPFALDVWRLAAQCWRIVTDNINSPDYQSKVSKMTSVFNNIFLYLSNFHPDNVEDMRDSLKAAMFASLAWKYINNKMIKK